MHHRKVPAGYMDFSAEVDGGQIGGGFKPLIDRHLLKSDQWALDAVSGLCVSNRSVNAITIGPVLVDL